MKGLFVAAAISSSLLFANETSVKLNYRYQEADTGRRVQETASVSIPQIGIPERRSTDIRIEKTLFVVDLANVLKDSLKAYEEISKPIVIDPVWLVQHVSVATD